jgi:hypothetical protein
VRDWQPPREQLRPASPPLRRCREADDEKPNILANYDARPENVFASSNGLRPRGDFSLVKPGTPEFDIARLEVPELKTYVDAYGFFRNNLEQERGQNFELSGADVSMLQRKVPKIAFAGAMRLGAFKLSKGLDADAQRYICLASTYAPLAKQNS